MFGPTCSQRGRYAAPLHAYIWHPAYMARLGAAHRTKTKTFPQLPLAQDLSPDINLEPDSLAPKCLYRECINVEHTFSKAVKPSVLFSESNKVCTSLHRESPTPHPQPVLKPLEHPSRDRPLSRSRTSTTYASRWRPLDGPRPITQAHIFFGAAKRCANHQLERANRIIQQFS